MRIVKQIDIRAPTEAVFGWLTERDKVMQWLPLLDSQITRDTIDRVGTALRQVYKAKRRRIELPVEVIAYEPSRWLVVRTKTKKQETTFDYRVERLHHGCRLTVVIDLHLQGFMKIVGLLVGTSIRDRLSRGCEEDFGRLKQLCEQEHASPSGPTW